MDLKGLRLFLGILKYGSITKASEHLHIAQPALGIHLRKLEDELGTQLVLRHSRGVTPTEAGLLLAEHAEILLRQFDRAKQELMDYASTARGRVTVGLTPSTIQTMSAELLTKIRETYPEVRITLAEALSDTLVEWLVMDRIDVALTYSQPNFEEVLFEPLASEAIYFAYPATELGRRGPAISLSDVLDHPLILPSEGFAFRQMAERAAAQVGKPLNVAVEIDSASSARDLVKVGVGYALKPLGAMRWEVEAGAMGAALIVDPPIERTLYLAALRDRPMSKAFEAVRESLRESVRSLATTRNFGWRLRREETQKVSLPA
jgi:LysR family nitrogen assimilation transcriptional regulator